MSSAQLHPPEQVQLPLHQRVALVKASRKGCTTSEAMKQIMQELGRPSLADPWQQAEVVFTDRFDNKENAPNRCGM